MAVGETKGAGWQIGVSRTLGLSPDEAWRLLTSPAGVGIWLGGGVRFPAEPGQAYETADGTAGEVRSYRPLDRIRLTWRPPSWSHETTVQVAIKRAAAGTTLRFHQERLADAAERARQRDHWAGVLDRLAGADPAGS